MPDERTVREALENRLMGRGVYVTSWAADGDEVDLEYEVVVDHDRITSDEVGTVLRTLLDVTAERDDSSPPTLRATSLSTDGATRGTWHVEADWLRRLHDDLSEVEFSELVLDTVELSVESEGE